MSILSAERHRVPSALSAPDWQSAMQRAIRDSGQLIALLNLPPQMAEAAAGHPFPLFAPLEYLSRIRKGDPRDPLLRQILPVADERQGKPGFLRDPVGDETATLMPGLIQKYEGRALIVLSGHCPVHCRYCFRQHFPYETSAFSGPREKALIAELRELKDVEEVVLSGGDPLTWTDGKLQRLISQIESVPHVRRLRIHSRMPVVIPQRVTPELLSLFGGTRLTTLFVVHINHPQEMDEAVEHALSQLIDAGIPVLNQAVLLRSVNDHAEVLYQLCRRLVNLRVMPYYLHQLDRVAGAAHFEVPINEGKALVQTLRSRLPGYAVPRYVVEEPGAASKTWLG